MRRRSDKNEIRRLRVELRGARAVLVHVRDHGVATEWDRAFVRNEIADIDRKLAPKRPRERRQP